MQLTIFAQEFEFLHFTIFNELKMRYLFSFNSYFVLFYLFWLEDILENVIVETQSICSRYYQFNMCCSLCLQQRAPNGISLNFDKFSQTPHNMSIFSLHLCPHIYFCLYILSFQLSSKTIIQQMLGQQTIKCCSKTVRCRLDKKWWINCRSTIIRYGLLIYGQLTNQKHAFCSGSFRKWRRRVLFQTDNFNCQNSLST